MASPLSSPRPTHPCAHRSSDATASADRASLRAYMNDSDCVIEHTMKHYKKFARQCYDGSVNKIFRRIATDQHVYLYEEKRETTTASSFIQEIWPGGQTRRPPVSPRTDDDSGRGRPSFSQQTQLQAFGGGEIAGSLDDVMAGVYAATADDHSVNCAVQFGLENVLDSGIMDTFENADDANPYRYFGVKFVEIAKESKRRDCDHDGESDGHAADATKIDELYWIERTGFHLTKSGRKFGYHVIKTVDSDYAMDDPLYRSIQLSACFLYQQVANDVVHVFVRGIVEVPHSSGLDMDNIVAEASAMLLAPARARQCHRMKMIAKMIERSKTERSELTDSAPIAEKPCSNASYFQSMTQRLASATSYTRHGFQWRPFHRQTVPSPLSCLIFSSYAVFSHTCLPSTTAANHSSVASPSSQISSLLHLQNHRGWIRRDGEIPEEIDPDIISYRMLLPIREMRPSSTYRERKKRNGNVLFKMLLKHEERRREIASDLVVE